MGVSAGGYASILFGSLCNVSSVIAFIPRTKLINPINKLEKHLDDKKICRKKRITILDYGRSAKFFKNKSFYMRLNLNCF